MTMQITAYKARDGKLFENKDQCDDYEVVLSLESTLSSMLENKSEKEKEIIRSFVIENRKPLLNVSKR